MITRFLLVVAIVMVAGCGGDSGEGNGNFGGGKAPYRYNYSTTLNGIKCETGERSFSTKADYCSGLSSDAQTFDSKGCTGTFNSPLNAYNQNCI